MREEQRGEEDREGVKDVGEVRSEKERAGEED